MSDHALSLAAIDSLAELHRRAEDPSRVVAWRGTGNLRESLDFARWQADVAHYVARLEQQGLGAGDRLALWCPDAYAFSVGLLAAWQRGCAVVSPPNDGRGTLSAIAAEGCRLASHSTGSTPLAAADPSLSLDFALAREGESPTASPEQLSAMRKAPPLGRDAIALVLSTSGTTGDGKSIPKLLRHLDDEVAILERHFGAAVAGSATIATPSHQHLYGLLFRVLWPLCAGRPFYAQIALQVEELIAAAGSENRVVLVSVPAHLSRIGQRDSAATLAGRCIRVFSSGGPLASETAARWRELRGSAPTEIFGSTETGGVAFREQEGAPDQSAGTPWRPFDGVRVACDETGCLLVRSPLCSIASSPAVDAFAMSDRVELLGDGSFRLQGRADRSVKIGERRLSLPEMEARLAALPEVREAALVTLEIAGEQRVAAAVVPEDPAWLESRSAETRALTSKAAGARSSRGRLLADALASDFDRVLLPRAWRFVPELPEDAQGKRSASALRALFAADSGLAAEESSRSSRASVASRGVDGVREPRRLSERRDALSAERLCEVPDDLEVLKGHFPNAPIVPAVAQLDWALRFAADAWGEALSVASVRKLRLTEMLRPGDRFWLRIFWLRGDREDDDRANAGEVEPGNLNARRARELGFALVAAGTEGSAESGREFASGRLVVEYE